ncbi:hypothetical protein DFH09DRAFT_1331259 [Mycena vulgaris]|nr:hypothetical protein DFH09DRAFT_1331259 [Mycena vulgaris]
MSSFNTPSLLRSEEDTVRLLHKSVRATHYDDPLDQDTFLVASARSILQFRDQYTAFAASPELSECVFSIRMALHKNDARLDSTCGEVLTAISDFAGEIVRSRQLFCDRQRAQTTCLHAEEAAEAHTAHRDALAYANKKVGFPALDFCCLSPHPPARPLPALQRVLSPDSDIISIPSDDEDTPPNKDPIPSPIEDTDATMIASPARVRSSALLSPLPELESLMFTIRLTSPALAPLASLSSPTQSLPDLVPIYPPSNGRPANGCDWPQKVMHALRRHRDHTIIPNPRLPQATAIRPPVLATPVPRISGRTYHRPSLNYINDSPMLRPESSGSRPRKSISASNYKRFKKPARGKARPPYIDSPLLGFPS